MTKIFNIVLFVIKNVHSYLEREVARPKKVWRPFKEARSWAQNYAQAHGIRTMKAWKKMDKTVLPKDIPSRPEKYYQDDGWKGYGDWLGTSEKELKAIMKEKQSKREYKSKHRCFEEARAIIRNMGFKSCMEWWHFATKENLHKLRIPTRPDRDYADKWISTEDWIGIVQNADEPKWVIFINDEIGRGRRCLSKTR